MLRGVAYWSRRTAFLFLTLMGILPLANVGVRLRHAWAGPDSLNRVVLGLCALSIVVIWALFLRYIRKLDKLTGRIEEKALNRLSQSTYAIGFLGYLMLLEAMLLIHRQ